MSVKENNLGNCVEGDYQEQYFSTDQILFYFSFEKAILKGTDLIFVVDNYTKSDYQIYLDKLSDIQWENNKNAVIERINSTLDTAEYRAIKWSATGKNEWEKYFHFAGTKQKFQIKTENLDYKRYRVRIVLDKIDTYFKEFDIVPEREVEWSFSDDIFLNPDSISFSLKNISGSRFFIPHQGEFVRLSFGAYGFKDGKKIHSQYIWDPPYHTGFHFESISNNETKQLIWSNPLTNESIRQNNKWEFIFFREDFDGFKELFHKTWGDSIKIRFFLQTNSLRWSSYKDQVLQSPEIHLSTSNLLTFWERHR